MMKKNNIKMGKLNSIIGVDTVFTGTLRTKETTRIDGKIEGDVFSEGTLVIGQTGQIAGNVKSVNIIVAGEIKGDISVTEKVEVVSTGRIFGDISTKGLVIDEHAVFQGKCIMNGAPGAVIEEQTKETVVAEEAKEAEEVVEEQPEEIEPETEPSQTEVV